MSSRMEKYYSEDNNIAKRTDKNRELYESVNESKIEKFSLDSNIAVLDDNAKNIDVNKIRDILDKKYREEPKRRSIIIDEEEEKEEIDERKEYDINTILSKAREEKEVNYEEDRLKRLRDTQFDILKSLKEEKEKEYKEEIQEEKNSSEDELMSLINTITETEMKSNEANALDILSDLKGDDNTEVYEGMTEEITEKIDNSFYTTSTKIDKDDFEDFEELKKEVKSNKAISVILIVFVILCLLGGVLFLLNNLLDLGLF